MNRHKDIKIIGKGGDVPATHIVVKNDFNQYCAQVIVGASHPLIGKFELSLDGTTIDIDSVSFVRKGGNYETTLFPSSFLKNHRRVFPPIKGEYKFEEILEIYGLKYITQKETDTDYWEIPRIRLCNFMDYVRDKVSPAGGGGFLLTYSFNGFILCDLKIQMEKDPQATMRGVLLEQSYDYSWYQNYPGDLNLTQALIEKTESFEFPIKEHFAKASLTELVTNEKLAYLTEREGRNQFYRAYYQNLEYKIRTDEPTIAVIGSTVAMAGQEDTTKGVLVGTTFGTGQCEYRVTTN